MARESPLSESVRNLDLDRLKLEQDKLAFEIRKFESDSAKRVLEEQKLAEEVRELRRHWYKKPTYLAPVSTITVALVGGPIAFGTDVFKSNVFKLQNERDTLMSNVKTLTSAKVKLSDETSKLTAENAGLVADNQVRAAKAQDLETQIRVAAKTLEQRSRESNAREMAAQALNKSTDDPELARLLAYEAVMETYSMDGTATVEAESALRHLTGPLRVLEPEPKCGTSIALSKDGSLAATVFGYTITLWDTVNGKHLGTFNNLDFASYVYLSPSGRKLVAATAGDDVIRVWDVALPVAPKLYFGFKSIYPVANILFSPDEDTLVAIGSESIVGWDLKTRRVIGRIPWDPLSSSIRGSWFGREGLRLFVEDLNSGQRVFLVNLIQKSTVPEPAFPIAGVPAALRRDVFVPEREIGEIREKGRVIRRFHTKGDGTRLVSPDGRILFISDDEGWRFLSIDSGRETSAETLRFSDSSVGFKFSEDSSRFVASGYLHAKVWSFTDSTVQVLTTQPYGIFDFLFGPGQQSFTLSGSSGRLVTYSLRSFAPTSAVTLTSDIVQLGCCISGESFSEDPFDGRIHRIGGQALQAGTFGALRGYIAVSQQLGRIVFARNDSIFDPKSGHIELREINSDGSKPLRTKDTAALKALTSSPNGKMFAASVGGSVVLLDPFTLKESSNSSTKIDALQLVFNQEGTLLLSPV